MTIIDELIEDKKVKLKEDKERKRLEKYSQFILFGNRYSLNLKECNNNWEVYIFNCDHGITDKIKEFSDYKLAYDYYVQCLGNNRDEFVVIK